VIGGKTGDEVGKTADEEDIKAADGGPGPWELDPRVAMQKTKNDRSEKCAERG